MSLLPESLRLGPRRGAGDGVAEAATLPHSLVCASALVLTATTLSATITGSDALFRCSKTLNTCVLDGTRTLLIIVLHEIIYKKSSFHYNPHSMFALRLIPSNNSFMMKSVKTG